MSLIIKGSIMPLMCEECPCYDCDDYACKATGRGVIDYRYDGRPDNCPLVEISTPHGRLIDADELIRCIEHAFGDKDIVKLVANIIERQPTIIEAEVSE